MRGGQPLDRPLLGQLAVVALADQPDPIDDRALQPGLPVGVADDPQRARQHRRPAPGIDAAQRGDRADPAAAPGDPQPQRADDPVHIGLGVAPGLDGDFELGERADGEGVIEGQEQPGFGCLGQALIGPALDLLILPGPQPALQRRDPVLTVDQVIPPAAVADRRVTHLLHIEGGGKAADPGRVEVTLGQRVDPHLGQRHPPQPRLPLDPPPDRAVASHRVCSFI